MIAILVEPLRCPYNHCSVAVADMIPVCSGRRAARIPDTYSKGRLMGRDTHIFNCHNALDWRDTENHAADGATDGMIAIQIHGGNRAIPGGFWRWRNIGVKELP